MAPTSRPEPSVGEKDETYSGYPGSHLPPASRRPQRRDGKTTMARKLMYGLLAFVLVALGLVSAAAADPNGWPGSSRRTAPVRGQAVLDDQDDSTFKQLLNSASPDVLHKLLHEYFPGTFTDGVYASDKSAVEAIRSEDAELATSIVHLAKRQNDSTAGPASISSTVLPSSSVPPRESSSSQPPASPSSTPSSAPPQSPTTTPTSSSEVVPSQTTPGPSPSGPGPSSSSTTPSGPGSTPSVIPSSSSGPSPGTSRSASLSGNGNPSSTTPGSPGTTLITSNSGGGTTPSASRRTVTYTSTLPGGRVTTVTSVEIVTGVADNAPPDATGQGRLQSGIAVPGFAGPSYEMVIVAIIGGVLVA